MSSSDDDLSSNDSSSDEELKSTAKRGKEKSKKSTKHHRKHSKSHKKEKKSKKKHKRKKAPSSSSENSSAEEWVTKEELGEKILGKSAEVEQKPAAERDEWMNLGSLIPTYSNESKRAKRQEEKQAKRLEASIETMGQHTKELNPYWKNGGKGLPEEQGTSTKEDSATVIGDGGLSWLKKAFLRAKQQAEEEGRSLEEIAEERWGSLEKFYEMLEKAEEKANLLKKHKTSKYEESPPRQRNRFHRPRGSGSEGDSGDDRRKRSHRRRSRSRERDERRRRYEKDRRSDERSWRKSKHEPEIEIVPKKKLVEEPPKVTVIQNPVVVVEEANNSDEEQPEKKEEVQVMTDKEMNELSAKILKAEMLGNEQLVASLTQKKEAAEKARKEFIATGKTETVKKVIKVVMNEGESGGRRKIKDKPGETHKDGQRVRYFPDDDRQTLQSMFEKEKRNTVENENALFSRLIGKGAKASADYDMDDIFTDKASTSKTDRKEKERELREIIHEDKVYKATLENCPWCFDGNKLQKNLVIAVGEKSFLCLPPTQSLTEGHCLIVPMYHTTCATQLDEDVWEEMMKFRKAVVDMFSERDEDAVIFELAVYLKKHPHMYLECVPMPKEVGELAPIYFKKAIQECESEWSQNKKLVELKNRNVRKAIPKGLPYFSVDFGLDSGFAHVIEDEQSFPRNFAYEIVGGMMELDHSIWRKQKQDDFKTQRDKVMTFLKTWGPYDWTREAS